MGADFSGAGSLINLPARTLRLLDGILSTDLGVRIENQGILQLGAAGQTGQIAAVDYVQTASGEMEVEFAGTALNEFDCQNLTGVASLAGTLDLALLGIFVPDLGNTFNILSASGGVTGTFATVNQPAALLAAGRKFEVVYDLTQLQLVVTNLLAGDYNQNGGVDAADYALWRDTLGGAAASPFSGADGDGDGTIDNDDYDVWRANFGQSAGSGSALLATAWLSAVVPEPPTMLVHLIALGATLLPRHARMQGTRSFLGQRYRSISVVAP